MFITLFSILSSQLLGCFSHHFFVSKTIMDYAPDKGVVEITMRFFSDDLEKALAGYTGSDFKINGGEAAAVQQVESYIRQHFSSSINGKSVVCNWVGMEAGSDLTYCYWEISIGEPLRSIEVMNDCLMEVFPEQQNIVDFSAHSTTQTTLLVKGATRHSFTR